MPHLLSRSVVVLVATALALSSCSSLKSMNPFADSAADQPKLTGDRIDITLRPDQLQPTPGATDEAFVLPEPQSVPNWAMAGGSAEHAVQHAALPASVTRAWSYSLGGPRGKGAQLLNTPVIHAGRLFAINTDAEVVALDARTGKELWEAELPLKEEEMARQGGGLAVSGDLLFITTAGGEVFALSASKGKKVWDTDLAVPLRAAPTVSNETLYVISHDNRIFALSALDGALQWTHSGMEQILGSMAAAAPAVGNGLVVAPYSSGELFVLRATDGRFLWSDTLTTPYNGQDPESTVTSISAPPVMADGLVYAVGMNGGLSAYGLANGQRFWKANITTSQIPWVAGMQVFVLTDKGELACLNRKDGTIRWVTDLNRNLDKPEGNRLWSGPVLAGGRLIVASSDGYALSLKPEDGTRLAAAELDAGTTLPPIVADDGLYFLTSDNEVIAFRAN